ncbi:MAG: hypothetical protein CL912_08415 [Deltaproteobacteria bacterium]|nr:hypothetical protein [Deltaproteobacteria bacterium]
MNQPATDASTTDSHASLQRGVTSSCTIQRTPSWKSTNDRNEGSESGTDTLLVTGFNVGGIVPVIQKFGPELG